MADNYESESQSQDDRDDDDDEEYEEADGGNRFLGFMFGNVDNSGDLDVDYLDEDAKEHLAALADKLGSSLTDIDLAVKSAQLSADAADQDYDEKAEDAVDYEDIDEQYEGPEIQAASEEDYLLPKKEYFFSEVSLATLGPKTSVFDDENYDEEEENDDEKEHAIVDKELEVQTISLSGQQDVEARTGGDKSQDCLQLDSPDTLNLETELEEFPEEDDTGIQAVDGKGSSPLSTLCTEDGVVILRFSEIFAIHEPMKKGGKRECRYSILKEKYMSMDASEIVEEDEETFLKGSHQVFASSPRTNEHEVRNDDPELAEFGTAPGAFQMSVMHQEQRKDSYLSPESMKNDLALDLSFGWQSSLCQNFYPFDQEDWEERILWDNTPVVSDSSQESCETFEFDTGASFIRETGHVGSENLKLELPLEIEEKDHNSSLPTSSVLLESFGLRDSPGPENLPYPKSKCHPQLLRLESQLEMDKDDDIGYRKENVAVESHQNDAIRPFSLFTFQNRDLMAGSWLDDIIWEPQKAHVKPKLIFNLQDEQMLFEVFDRKDSKHLRLHAGAMVITRSTEPTISPQLLGHPYQSGWQFNIANDKFYMNRKISQQMQSSSSKRIACGLKVHHSAPAIKLQTMKLKLSNKDLYNFHRPKALWYPHDNKVAAKEQGKLPTLGPIKVILKSLGGKGTKLHAEAEETILSIKAKASKKLDFKPLESVKIFYSGKELEEHRSLAAQNVQPKALLHLVRTKIHLLPRAQMISGENKSLCPPGAFKKKSDLSVKDGHVFLMEYCEERPLLLSNIGMGANLCTYYQKSSPSDQTGISLRNGKSSLGTVVGLEPTDKSPFLGDIRAGCTQSSLETNMYKAPIFPHKVASTDYLLVRSPKGKLSIRRIDRVAVVGQQEPLMEVFTPGSKNLQAYMVNRVLVHMYREFRAAEKRGVLPWVRVDELSAQFPNVSETILRKKLKECAILQKGADGRLFWSKKRDFSIPSEDDLKKSVLPENVCAYESMQAGVYHLKHLGITRVKLPTSVSTAVSQLPDEAIALAAASHIERELQITPWNLSGNFVACTNQERDNIERLEITGVGDPSGRGLGFSYVRVATKAPMSNAISKRKPATGRGGSSVTGTDADLRRLSLEAAREVLLKFNVDEEEIAKHTRWHRIAMIRKLSCEQAASGVKVDHTTIGKYARGHRMSFLQLQQQTREKCQEIWERQVQSLSAIEGDENGSDSEANSDLDSFAGDLENLLDAEELEGEESSQDCKHEKADSMKGIKMRRRPLLAQAEEEFEDEAAEAAELCRLLMDEDEAEQKKKKKLKAREVGGGLLQGSKLNLVGNAEKVKKTNKSQISGSYAPKVNSITNLKEVETAFGKKNMSDKGKTVKRIGTPITTLVATKVKILGDGLKIFKEKKPTRENFVCGACGQLGHMRTNKHCPKYGEEPEAQVETSELETAIGKSNPLDPLIKSQQKLQKKRSMPKFQVKIETSDSDKLALKSKALPVKFICGSTEKCSDKNGELVAQSSDQPASSDIEIGSRPLSKVNKIIICNKAKPEDLHKPSIVIRSPADVDNGEIDSRKPVIVIQPRTSDDRDFVESPKPSIVILPPAVNKKEKAHKKVVIKRPKEIVDLDQLSQDGSPDFDYRKTKRIVELSGFGKYGRQKTPHLPGETAEKKAEEERRWWEEEEKRRHTEKLREERAQRMYEEEMRAIQESERLAELRRYEVATRRERDEEERQKSKKKRKKPELSDDYLEDFKRRKNDRRMPESERGAKKRNVDEVGRFGAEYIPATKRRRAGEVGLASVLKTIVDALRDRVDVSYLFVKPVSKKEAPDYYDIIRRPMDLSIIKNKVRKMEYKRRDEFRHDVWQISYNAHTYNDGRNPGIPPLADQLLEICDYLLEEYHHSLNEAEGGI